MDARLAQPGQAAGYCTETTHTRRTVPCACFRQRLQMFVALSHGYVRLHSEPLQHGTGETPNLVLSGDPGHV